MSAACHEELGISDTPGRERFEVASITLRGVSQLDASRVRSVMHTTEHSRYLEKSHAFAVYTGSSDIDERRNGWRHAKRKIGCWPYGAVKADVSRWWM